MLPYGLYYLGLVEENSTRTRRFIVKFHIGLLSCFPSCYFFFYLLEIIKLSLARNNNLLQQIQLYIYIYV